ncbi:hypothetical protein [Bacillus chungangensis]|uniref:Phr family secreted Rap phosphatase inhibitor n=1 Tax=Bacillus chungangensis TaxID=587633 RepID=A0ABT9WN88_9BACI|nr:hypothetical protein [Bacillus chungangensis]MDQ0174661.1 hypothetical protein [Bacillus chungangensis]
MKKLKLMLVGFVAIGALVFGTDIKEASFDTASIHTETNNFYVGFNHGKYI